MIIPKAFSLSISLNTIFINEKLELFKNLIFFEVYNEDSLNIFNSSSNYFNPGNYVFSYFLCDNTSSYSTLSLYNYQNFFFFNIDSSIKDFNIYYMEFVDGLDKTIIDVYYINYLLIYLILLIMSFKVI